MRDSWALFLAIIFLIILLVTLSYWVYYIFNDYQEYKIYKSFCESKPDFCYCNLLEGGCEFKTSSSYSCTNNDCSEQTFSQDTIELCNIAKKLNDKGMLFKAGCNG